MASLLPALVLAISLRAGDQPTGGFGDCNIDGVVSIADINRLVDWINNAVPKPAPGTLPFIFCDLNGDGVLDMTDVNLLTNRLLGVNYTFPVENWGDGDANMDGVFGMSDLNLLVDWMLGRQSLPAPGSVQFLLADVNGDGFLTMVDLNLYVDKILGRIPVLPDNKLYGDSNLDGVFNTADRDLLQAWILGSQPMPVPGSPEFIRSDVNGDGVLDMADLNLYNDMLLVRITRFPVQKPVWVAGDSNLDGVFNTADRDLLQAWILGSSPVPAPGTIPFILSDVNGDGVLNMADLNLYNDKLLGRISKFPIELYGNSNLDGVVDNSDLILMQNWIGGVVPKPGAGSMPFILSDVNRDGSITMADIQFETVYEYDFFAPGTTTVAASFQFNGIVRDFSPASYPIPGFTGFIPPSPASLDPCDLTSNSSGELDCRLPGPFGGIFYFVFNFGGFPRQLGPFTGSGFVSPDAAVPGIGLKSLQNGQITQTWRVVQANQPFVTPYNLSGRPLRNNVTGWLGMKLTVGATDVTVTSLGRIFVAGNNGTHTIKLVRVSDGADVPGGSVLLSMAGGTLGQFSYASLPSPITLQAHTSYYLVSQEFQGGDKWYDYGTIFTTSAATVNNAAYWNGTSWALIDTAQTSYVPPNFR
ncbi:MAG: dockerin type I repeat-containing protein [Acidobacteriia bacterium]|nr:dockerin type I repeat-containing protein [Terriglobia bacterium]